MDITEHILFQHHEQRRAFALLDEVPRHDKQRLNAIWERLEVLLEVHAAAEERFFYPRLLDVGTGGGGADSAASETKDAIKDHNEIRDAVQAAGRQEVGSAGWWSAVLDARKANGDHMAEEEREALADFRRHADLQTRRDIALAFVTFESQHANGIEPRNRDPGHYVDEHA